METACHIPQCGGKGVLVAEELEYSLQFIEIQLVATRSLQSGPPQRKLKVVLMDVKHHSKIGFPFTMIEVMNRVKMELHC